MTHRYPKVPKSVQLRMQRAISVVGLKAFAARLGVDFKTASRWSGLKGPSFSRIKNSSRIPEIEALCDTIDRYSRDNHAVLEHESPLADAASMRLSALADALSKADHRTPGYGATRVIQQHHQRLSRLEADVNSMRTIVDWIAREFGVTDATMSERASVNGKEVIGD